ncbi:hypothetical protein CPY51_29840 [Rhizobium tubonense]|uniref:DNA 3'-5' helicase II n=1 Tax=Rhizobium tubonense TaxID=484088 RepID=A0A2W4C9Q5_9HYPH|nr:hypothetical protein CPY51_29840 [Rhizobium tubonense]
MRLFAALASQLNDDFLVLHSVAWIAKPKGNGPRDGEVDFLICHPRRGLLIIEVKGGRVDLDYSTRRWTSTDRHGVLHDIKNPFDQAKRGKFGILEKLAEVPQWRQLNIGRFPLGHSVFLPDVDNASQLAGPDAPTKIIGDRRDLVDVARWVEEAYSYWTEPDAGRRIAQLGQPGIEVIRRVFARVASTRALISARLHTEEQDRISFTERQTSILDLLSRQRRVMIAGGAGTGKTLIAREKAVRTAAGGLRTLLVCYNRGLADHLREQCSGVDGLDVATFHQLCTRWIERAKNELRRDFLSEVRREYPAGNEFDNHQPIALAHAVDALGPRYDAIIVDEGQDFADDFWMPLEMIMTDHSGGLFYVFLDENQDIYKRSSSVPVAGEPMVLDKNCRNTSFIHDAAYRHYRGASVQAPPISGTAVELLAASDLGKQARAIASLVTRLVAEEGVPPHEIGILLCSARDRETFETVLAASTIPKAAKWGRLESYGPGSVTVDSVARFKGLERSIIVLWALDNCDPERDREILYVGMSRAKSLLYICGTKEGCERAIGLRSR